MAHPYSPRIHPLAPKVEVAPMHYPQATQAPKRMMLETLEDRTVPSISPLGLDLENLRVDTGSYASSHILVKFQPEVEHQPALAGTSVGPALNFLPNLYQVNLTPGVSVEQALEAYRNDPRVLLAEPDYELTALQLPQDSLFHQQSNLNTINAPAAWDANTGATGGAVAVIDTGIDYTHTDLYRNIYLDQDEIPVTRLRNLRDLDNDGLITFHDLNDPRNQGQWKAVDVDHNGQIDARDILTPMSRNSFGQDNGFGGWADGDSQDGDSFVDDLVGWDFHNYTNKPFDDNGHGTHVGGILGASGNNGTGITGINWQTQILPVKFLGANGSGSIVQFLSALDYVLAQGVKISNNSWSGASNSRFLREALERAQDQGHVVVVAAGNNRTNIDQNPNYPSSFPLDNVVSVTATDGQDRLAGFANFGAGTVDLGAPGVSVLSTVPHSGYARLSGTSMAVPHVAGALALVWDQNPHWNYTQVIDRVMSTVDPVQDLQHRTVSGGRLNLEAALGSVPKVVVPPPPPPPPVPPPPPEPTRYSLPTIISSVGSGPRFDLLNKIRVRFDRAINVSTFSANDIRVFTPTYQTIPVQAVTQVAGSSTEFDIFLPTQSEPGNYLIEIGPEVRDQHGLPMSFYRDTIQVEPYLTYTQANGQPIQPSSNAISYLTVEDDIAVGDLQVVLDAKHPDIGDLTIHLQSPNGTHITLLVQQGNLHPELRNVIFDDDAVSGINPARSYVRGNIKPHRLLSRLKGQNARGVWKLWIENQGGSSGELNSWGLQITPTANAVTPAQAIPDTGRTVSFLRVAEQVKVQNLVVTVDIDHQRPSDLQLSLQSPTGMNVRLVLVHAVTGGNLRNISFSDDSTLVIGPAQPPLSGGIYRSDMPLSLFNGEDAVGEWKLWVEDQEEGITGVIRSWSLMLSPETTSASIPTGLARANLAPANMSSPAADTPDANHNSQQSQAEIATILEEQEDARARIIDENGSATDPRKQITGLAKPLT